MFFKDSYDSCHSMRAGKVNTSLPLFFLTSAQIRAARSLIRWTAEDLAAASALSVATIRRAELKENQTALTSANDLAIRRASESAGVEFIDETGGGPGVRLRKRTQPFGIVHVLITSETAEHRLPEQTDQRMAPVLAGAGISEHLTSQSGQAEFVVEFAVGEQPSIGLTAEPRNCSESAFLSLPNHFLL